MAQNTSPRRQLLSFCVTAAALAAPLTGASAMSSGAYGITANFTVGKSTVTLGPIGPLNGASPPTYALTSALGSYQQSLQLISGSAFQPTLSVSATGLNATVASNGMTVDTLSGKGDSSITSLNMSLTLPPLPYARGPVLEPYLTVAADKISSHADIFQVVSGPPAVNTSTGFANLSITGSLVHNKIITLNGTAKRNAVLYKSATVVITAHDRLDALLISCHPNCQTTPVSTTNSALDIKLTNAVLNGKKVSGEIIIAETQAGTETVTPVTTLP